MATVATLASNAASALGRATIGLVRDLAVGLGLGVYAVKHRIGAGRWRSDLRTRSGRVGVVARRRSGPRILVHGVSVGEIHALEPLVGALGRSPRTPDVVVSASTETGHARAQRLYGESHEVVRFPLDLTWMVGRFLDSVRPDMVALAELELWPSFLAACWARGIPVCVVGGRLSKRSFRGYSLGRLLVARMFRRLALVVAQTETDRSRFEWLGALPQRTVVGGSLKWDASATGVDAEDGEAEAAERLAAELGVDRARPLVVAGSTGPGEEKALLDRLPPECQLLLAPRDPDRWDEVARLAPGMRRRTQASSPPAESSAARAFLLDTLGELTVAYRLADAAFVGRSLVPMGGSNPLESVARGKPTVTGPHCENFRGVVEALQADGGIVVTDRPMATVGAWLADPDAAARVVAGGRRALERNRGASERTARELLRIL